MSIPAGFSALQVSDLAPPTLDDPVYATTAFLANGGDGRWCDVDVYLDMVAPLDEHAYAYVGYLQQSNGADAAMMVAESELPVGATFYIEVFDPERARHRAHPGRSI